MLPVTGSFIPLLGQVVRAMIRQKTPALLTFLLLTVALGCAQIPEKLDLAVSDVRVSDVKESAQEHVGKRVRWGGIVHDVENREQDTLVTIIAKPLDDSARPTKTTEYFGRFILRIESFVDPVTLPVGREMTAVGLVEPTLHKKIGDYVYPYPLLKTEHFVLWPKSTSERETIVIIHDLGPSWYYPYAVTKPVYLKPNNALAKPATGVEKRPD